MNIKEIKVLDSELKILEEQASSYKEEIHKRSLSSAITIYNTLLSNLISISNTKSKELDDGEIADDSIIIMMNQFIVEIKELEAQKENYLNLKEGNILDFIKNCTEKMEQTFTKDKLEQLTPGILASVVNAIDVFIEWIKEFFSEIEEKPRYQVQFWASDTESKMVQTVNKIFSSLKSWKRLYLRMNLKLS